MQYLRTSRGLLASVTAAILMVFAGGGSPARGGGTVTNNTTEALLTAMQGGGLVQLNFNSTLNLEVPLVVGADTVIEGVQGSGGAVVLSGGGRLRLFRVLPGIRLELRNVELREGLSTNGGGVYNEGILVASNVVFTACAANGIEGEAGAVGEVRFDFGHDGTDGRSGMPGAGGAVFSSGEASFLNCTFNVNESNGGGGGAGGAGGVGGSHVGHGGNGGHGASGFGGAISSAGRLVVNNSVFAGNVARGGAGGEGGSNGSSLGAGQGGGGATAGGGAIHSTGWLLLLGSSFNTNLVAGGDAAAAGAPFQNLGFDGYAGGNALGGAVASWSTGIVVNTTFYTNLVAGGRGGDGAEGTFVAGDGGDGGGALGAAIHARGRLSVTNVTFAWNSGTNGPGGAAGPDGRADPGGAGRLGGGGIAADSGTVATVVNSIFASADVPTVDGPVQDAGHNLFTDAGISPTGPGSILRTDPLLSAYQVWSIGTPGFLPLSGSPAADAADPDAAPATDQRGLPRPGGLGPDIGAFEVGVLTYLIGGHVLEGTHGLPGIKVSVGTNSMLTSADGGFRFGPLPSGFYTVELENEGAGFTPRLIQLSLTSHQTNLVFQTALVALKLRHDVEAGVDSLTGSGAIPNHEYRLEGSVDLAGWMLLRLVTSDSQGRVNAVHQPGAVPVWFYRIVAP